MLEYQQFSLNGDSRVLIFNYKTVFFKANLVEGVEQLQVGSRRHLPPLRLLANLVFLLQLLSHDQFRCFVVADRVYDPLFLLNGITLNECPSKTSTLL